MRHFLIADLHFFHDNIVEYENRPFSDGEDMNNQLILNWNNTVKKRERVFVLGDVSFGNRSMTKDIITRLNGHKTLILGNHDRRKSVKYWKDVGFDEVSKYPILFENHFILSHEPLNYVPGPFMNIHGHMHSKSMNNPKKYFSVSCEQIDYKPIDFKIIWEMHYDI